MAPGRRSAPPRVGAVPVAAGSDQRAARLRRARQSLRPPAGVRGRRRSIRQGGPTGGLGGTRVVRLAGGGDGSGTVLGSGSTVAAARCAGSRRAVRVQTLRTSAASPMTSARRPAVSHGGSTRDLLGFRRSRAWRRRPLGRRGRGDCHGRRNRHRRATMRGQPRGPAHAENNRNDDGDNRGSGDGPACPRDGAAPWPRVNGTVPEIGAAASFVQAIRLRDEYASCDAETGALRSVVAKQPAVIAPWSRCRQIGGGTSTAGLAAAAARAATPQ